MKLLVLCLILCITNIYSQVKLEWEARYHFVWSDGGSSVVVDDSGYVYVAGTSTQDLIFYNPDYVTIKYTPTGDTVWIRRWDWNNQFDGGGDILVDSIGNVYVCGHPVVLKYNSSGELLWESEHIAEFIRIEIDSEGNIYAAGTRLSNYMTVKFNTDGQEIWRRSYNGPGNEQDDLRDMMLDSKGNIIVTGESWGGSTTNYDFATIKYSGNGDTLWIRRYNGPALNPPLDGGFGMAIDTSDNIYVTGWSQGPAEKANTLTLKYSPDGDLLWERRFPEDGQISNSGYDMVIDKDGFIYVASRAFGFRDFLNKYDSDGNHLWTAEGEMPNLFYTVFPRIATDKYGSIYMTSGNVQAPNNEYSNLLKFDSSGKQLWKLNGIGIGGLGAVYGLYVDTSLKIYITGEILGEMITMKISPGTTSIEQDEDFIPSEFQLLPAYPNPFNSGTNITFTLPQSAEVEMKIYNILGEEIATLISYFYSAVNTQFNGMPEICQAGCICAGLVQKMNKE